MVPCTSRKPRALETPAQSLAIASPELWQLRDLAYPVAQRHVYPAASTPAAFAVPLTLVLPILWPARRAARIDPRSVLRYQ